jgi:hypothetical protein
MIIIILVYNKAKGERDKREERASRSGEKKSESEKEKRIGHIIVLSFYTCSKEETKARI